MFAETNTYSTLLLQDRLKKLKSEHGKVQLGNINVDMVWISHYQMSTDTSGSFLECICILTYYVKLFLQVLGGMRGMIGMLWETSLLDPEEVILHSSPS
jgi:citrate synthase